MSGKTIWVPMRRLNGSKSTYVAILTGKEAARLARLGERLRDYLLYAKNADGCSEAAAILRELDELEGRDG